MKHLKIFESIDTWDKHPQFDSAVKKVTKAIKKKQIGGVGWVEDLLGDTYPDSKAFIRRVVIVSNKNLSEDK